MVTKEITCYVCPTHNLMNLIEKNYLSSSDDEDSSPVAKDKQTDPIPSVNPDNDREHVHKTSDSVHSREHQVTHTLVKGYISKRKRPHTSDHVNPEPSSPDKYTSLSSYLSNTTASTNQQRPLQWIGHHRPIMSLDWHPFHPNLLLSSSLDSLIKVWDTTSKEQCIASHSFHTEAVQSAQWISPNHVISGGFDKSMIHTDIETMKVVRTMHFEGMVTALTKHPTDSNIFVTGDSLKNVQTWDLRIGKASERYFGAGGQILDVAFINGGQELVASSDIVRKNAASQMLLVWETRSTIVRSHQIYCEPYTCVCLQSHPYDDIFVAQSNANYAVIFNSKRPYKMNKYKRFESHLVEGYKTQIDINSGGSVLASASADGKVYIYDYYSTRLRKTHSIGSSPTLAVQWHPTLSSILACSSWNGTIAIIL